MSAKNTPCEGSKTDDSDDERINRLIARYANIHDTSKERQVGDFKTDKNNDVIPDNPRSIPGQTKSMMQADPMQDNYAYKILSTDSSEKANDFGHSRVRLTWDDSLYDSLCSHSHDTESSISNKRDHRLKLPPENPPISKSRVTFRDQIRDEYQQTSFTDGNILEKSYAEKTTYCRPINKSYDNNFVHEVMEKNAKLQLLLTKYVIARQKEKEKQKWNDYVHKLIEKRRCYRNLSTQSLSARTWGEDINRSWVKHLPTENKLTQSESCQEIIRDLYSPKNELFLDIPLKFDEKKPINNKPTSSVYDNYLHCFPSTSKERQRKTNEERTNHEWPCHRSMYGPRIMVSNDHVFIDNAARHKMHEHTSLLKSKMTNHTEKSYKDDVTCGIEPESKENKNIQTHVTFRSNPNLANYFPGDIISELLIRNKNRIHDNVTRKKTRDRGIQCKFEIKELHQVSMLTSKQKMMRESLEREHEIFNNLFRSFMTDLDRTESPKPINSDIFRIKEIEKTTSRPKANKKKNTSIVGNVMTNTSLSAFELQTSTSQLLLNSRFDQILYEELLKSNQLRSDVEAMLNHTECRPCGVQISLDIPTRERSTEVTDSLSKTKLTDSLSQKMVAEVSSLTDHHVRARQKYDKQEHVKSERRIAVNTDPVGLLSLLKLSTETAKQILSFVPMMGRYLPRALPAPAPPPPRTDYVCSVCGAIFARPSELSAHILEHNFGQVRQCRRNCPAPATPGSQFRCQYCGQRFSRAHCCELHQCACARRRDARHDGSGLVMLR